MSTRSRLLRTPVRALVAVVLLAPAHASAAEPAPADVGHRGHGFAANAVADPSGEKPQSKLWFADDAWWGSLFKPSTATETAEEFRIHRLDPSTQQWIDTGTALDDRNSSKADVLWDGTFLYVASGSDVTPQIRLYRYRYDRSAQRYVPDPGLMTEIGSNAGPVEAVVLAKEVGGRLWITYERDGIVYVAHSGASDGAWGAPIPLPVEGAANLTGDDISAVVSFENKVGVMWSNQTDEKVYFAEHVVGAPDSEWGRTIALQGPRSADDHISLKSLQADAAGRVFAAVKTSHGDDPAAGPGAAQVLLLALQADGSWATQTVGTVGDDHTRPIVLTNQRTRRLYVLATSPTVAGDGVQSIYYKETSLDNPIFAPGLGTPFMQSASGLDINDATSTKQDLAGAPGLVALASDDTNYWHNLLAAGGESSSQAPGGAGSSQAPGGEGAWQSPGGDRERPRLRRLAVRPTSFRPARLRAAGRRRGGAVIRFRLSEPARVRFAVRRRGRVRVTGRFSRAGMEGRNRVRFRGRLAGRALAAGRYRLVAVAVDRAGNRSPATRAAFRVLR